MHDLHTSSMDPAAAAAALPPGKASPRQGWASITLPALLASTLLRKAKKAEGAPHWGPPPPSMKNNSRPAGKIGFHHNCLCRRHDLMQVCRLRTQFAVKVCNILDSSATIRQAVKTRQLPADSTLPFCCVLQATNAYSGANLWLLARW